MVDDLRISYEKYFLGVERIAPANKHRVVKARMRQLEQIYMRSTALRFRLQGLRARLVTYEHYWNRILGQIERGTFRRDLQKRTARKQPDQPRSDESREDAARRQAPRDAAAPADETLPTAARPPPPPGASPPPPPVPGMGNAEIRALFDSLVEAKRAAGEDTRGLTVRALARKLSRELPKLRQRHGARVEFEVATVGGRVTLRARPRGE